MNSVASTNEYRKTVNEYTTPVYMPAIAWLHSESAMDTAVEVSGNTRYASGITRLAASLDNVCHTHLSQQWKA